MATKTITQLVDDFDGTELSEDEAETVPFSLDGRSYSLDLSHKHAEEFKGLFQDAISKATKVGGSRKGSGKPSNAKEVRAWAKDQGMQVPDRGRIPASVQDAYDAK